MRTTVQRTLAIAGVVGVLAGVVVLGAPAPAEAVPVAAAPVFEPSGSKPRAFMINVLGSVLGKATPSKWKAERLANEYRLNAGWETIAVEVGMAGPMNGDYRKNPSSYDDHVLRGIEQKERSLGTRAKRMFAVPNTTAGKIWKTVNGVGAAVVGVELGQLAGRGIASVFGLNAEGTVCGGDTFLGVDWDAAFVGADCAGWNALVDEAIANADASAGVGGGPSCNPAGVCVTLVGVFTYTHPGPPAYTEEYWVWNVDGMTVATNQTNWPSASHAIRYSWVGESSFASTSLMNCKYSQSGHWLTGVATACRDNFGADSGMIGGVNSAYPATSGRVLERYYLSGDPLHDPAVGGTPQPVVESNGDPERFITCEILGTDSNTYTAQGSSYHESSGSIGNIVCPSLPDGVYPAETWWYDNVSGKSDPLYNEASTDAFVDWATDFWHCDTGSCQLDLVDVSGTYPVSCFDSEACDGWFEDPARDTKYQCTYGGENVDISECFVYSGTFNPQRIQIGAPYSDPLTGVWSGGENAPKPGEEVMASGVMNPEETRNCWARGWSEFNPAEWILTPVKCALEWAFVPREAVVNLATAEAGAEWEKTPVAQIGTAVGNWSIAPTASGCAIPVTIPMPFIEEHSFNVLDACEGSWIAPVAAISRVVTSAAFVVLVVVILRRQFGAVVDYKP